jgi:hypothetical protein
VIPTRAVLLRLCEVACGCVQTTLAFLQARPVEGHWHRARSPHRAEGSCHVSETGHRRDSKSGESLRIHYRVVIHPGRRTNSLRAKTALDELRTDDETGSGLFAKPKECYRPMQEETQPPQGAPPHARDGWRRLLSIDSEAFVNSAR